MENWRNNFVSMSKNDLLEMISNLEVQLNEAEDKITMFTHLQVRKNSFRYLKDYFRQKIKI